MTVDLFLKVPYTYGNPDKKLWSNDQGQVCTDADLTPGKIVSFEYLLPTSLAGQLNTDHYQYFSGRSFRVGRSRFTSPAAIFRGRFDLVEI